MQNLPDKGPGNISSTVIADALGIHNVQVRKDLAVVSNNTGKPKIGYITKDLIADLERFLGHDNYTDAVLVGVGNLGKAFLCYDNFKNYGLRIVAAFDSNPSLIGTEICGVKVLDSSQIANACNNQAINVGIITVPACCAQDICDRLVTVGVRAIWNFAPINLKTQAGIVIKNEDMAASLAMLTRQLKKEGGKNDC